jgi:anti-sigma regulatory factor (Ser/Thr protein kinase)
MRSATQIDMGASPKVTLSPPYGEEAGRVHEGPYDRKRPLNGLLPGHSWLMTQPVGALPPVTVRVFAQRLSATPRGARLARLLAVQQLDAWGYPYRSTVSDRAAAIVAELAANAVTHGRVPGRDFELALTLHSLHEHDATLWIETTDTRWEARPPVNPPVPAVGSESGRGLVVVDALANRWGVTPHRGGGPGKTVRAELEL